MGSGDGNSSSKKSRKPDYSRFTQQELPACKPILTPQWVVTAFIFLGIVFIPIGLASLSASKKVVEIVERYDSDCIPTNYTKSEHLIYHEKISFIQSSKTNKTCVKTLTIPKKMKHPIYIYYQLANFYQNHRRYVKSRSDEQLRDSNYKGDLKKNCAPEDTNGNGPVVPCGLIAWSLFNDTYGFSRDGKALQVNRKNISWPSDRKYKFGSKVYPKNFQNGSLIGGGKLDEKLPLSEHEDLQVWMRTAALPIFRKLYGKVEEDLEAGQKITVVIQNNYNTYEFDGKKSVVLSTTTWIGGKNPFLGVAYLTVGGVCLFVAITFILMYVIKPRPFGDPAYLSWNLNPSVN